MDLDNVLTTTGAARELGITPQSVRNAIARGLIQSVKLGGVNFIDRAEIERYLEENRTKVGRPRKQAGAA